MSVAREIFSRIRSSIGQRAMADAPAPRRPIVMIQSDDWGRVGIPLAQSIDTLRNAGADVGRSKWDSYGLENEGDIIALGEVLARVKDRDGRTPCMTANFVMANADLPRMRDERYQHFRWVPITSGFPKPWSEDLVHAYRANIDIGVFEPGLHGFTHFNAIEMIACLNEDSERGKRARLLADHDVPYLASYTPEYNFALVSRRDGERFLDTAAQESWIRSGIEIFREAFGIFPRSTCAPGYRANTVTKRIWRTLGVESYEVLGNSPLATSSGLLQLNRNVHFEPVLSESEAVSNALRQAERAVLCGTPIIICTHSINYITRFVGAAERSRQLLQQLLASLLELFPNLRFAGAGEVTDAWRNGRQDWFLGPSAEERALRRGAASEHQEATPS